jgi:alpha/beta superfamily hydrolase
MPAHTENVCYAGAAGRIDCAIDWPDQPPRGWALVLHPHPLHEGSRNNKVVTTMARACVQHGLVALRPDFRGVGKSEGSFDKAAGETADMRGLVDQFLQQHPECAGTPWVLAGFSFGTSVAAQLHAVLADDGGPLPAALILAGAAVWRFQHRDVSLPADTLVVHGEQDEVVPLQQVFDWIRPLDTPVVVMPGASHFFHGKLIALRRLVADRLARIVFDAPA